MTTEPTKSRRPAAVAVGLAAVAGTIAITAIGVGVVTARSSSGLPPGLRDQLAAQVAEILERSSPVEHHEHGHEFGDQPARVVCAVEPFGVEPAGATTVAEVRWVYAQHLCAVDDSGASWQSSIRASGPLAVELASRRVLIPRSGAGYPDRVREVIPRRYQDAAFGTFTDPSLIDAARRRFEGGTARRTP